MNPTQNLGSSTDRFKALSVAKTSDSSYADWRGTSNRGMVRSANNPTGDLAEYLFCHAFGWQQAPSSERGYDATGADGTRYQSRDGAFIGATSPASFPRFVT